MKVIKESFDNLPAVVCIFNDKGLVRLMNHQENRMARMAINTPVCMEVPLRMACSLAFAASFWEPK